MNSTMPRSAILTPAIAVLDDIMRWVGESQPSQDDFTMWLFGPAGAGKSVIAKRIVEIATEMDLPIAFDSLTNE